MSALASSPSNSSNIVSSICASSLKLDSLSPPRPETKSFAFPDVAANAVPATIAAPVAALATLGNAELSYNLLSGNKALPHSQISSQWFFLSSAFRAMKSCVASSNASASPAVL